VGVVEEVGMNGKKAFSNYDELWDILNPARGLKMPERTGEKRSRREGR